MKVAEIALLNYSGKFGEVILRVNEIFLKGPDIEEVIEMSHS